MTPDVSLTNISPLTAKSNVLLTKPSVLSAKRSVQSARPSVLTTESGMLSTPALDSAQPLYLLIWVGIMGSLWCRPLLLSLNFALAFYFLRYVWSLWFHLVISRHFAPLWRLGQSL